MWVNMFYKSQGRAPSIMNAQQNYCQMFHRASIIQNSLMAEDSAVQGKQSQIFLLHVHTLHCKEFYFVAATKRRYALHFVHKP